MERSLRKRGLIPCDSAEKADYHIINTCSFIEPAREETIQTALEAAEIKTSNPRQKLILSGCFSERYPDEIKKDLPEVDFIFGTGNFDRAGEIIEEQFRLKPETGYGTPSLKDKQQHYAPLKISEGCNRSCTFCSIPQFRGKFRNLEKNKILAEASLLAKEGVKELEIVSQDTVSFGNDPDDLLDLLEEIQQIQGIEWIRLLYLYPDRKTEKILEGIKKRKLPTLVPYFECPIQHASDRILRSMKRAGSASFYSRLFSLARSVSQDLEIRTSFILGFPGETEEDVEKIIEFIQSHRIEKVSLFRFFPEENTAAALLKDMVPEETVLERMNEVRRIYLDLLREIHRERMGKVYKCIVDSIDGSSILARRPQDAPEIDESVILPFREGIGVGDIIPVKITGYNEYDMTGIMEC